MNRLVLLSRHSSLLCACALAGLIASGRLAAEGGQERLEAQSPVRVAEGLFDPSQNDTQGVGEAPGAETLTIFAPRAGEMQFNNHPQLAVFKSRLYAAWVGHPVHETGNGARVFYSSSGDGRNWTKPLLTNIPDSDSMQCAGRLPDGSVYFVNNPVPVRRRVPLTLALSKDGLVFDRAFLVRGTPPPRRFGGISKTLGYSYPGGAVFNGHLYIAYATNKEDVEVTRIPLASLMVEKTVR